MLSSDQTNPPAFRDASNPGKSQTRGGPAAASRLSYTPERSNAAQGSQSSATQAAQVPGLMSQAVSEQPSTEQARWQFEGRREAQSGGGSEVGHVSCCLLECNMSSFT